MCRSEDGRNEGTSVKPSVHLRTSSLNERARAHLQSPTHTMSSLILPYSRRVVPSRLMAGTFPVTSSSYCCSLEPGRDILSGRHMEPVHSYKQPRNWNMRCSSAIRHHTCSTEGCFHTNDLDMDPSAHGRGVLTVRRLLSSSVRSRSRVFDPTYVTTRMVHREWHHPHFMEEATVEEKDAWLRNLLNTNDDSEINPIVDTEAYLVLLRSLAGITHPGTTRTTNTNSDSQICHVKPSTPVLPDAHLRAEKWLIRLERHAERLWQLGESASSHTRTVQPLLLPTPECYCCVIQAWANASGEDPALAVIRAERWLHKILDHPTFGTQYIQPNTDCFNAFLDLCSKGRGLKDRKTSRNRNNTSHYNDNNQSRQGANDKPNDLVRQHALKAEQTLHFMMAQSHPTKAMTVEGDDSDTASTMNIAPNTDSFNYVIRAWTRCRNDFDVADRAMDVLRQLEHYQATVDSNVKPNGKSYIMVMDALAIRAKLKVKRIRTRPHLWDNPDENGNNEIKLLQDILAYLNDRAQDEATGGDASLVPNTHAMNTLVSAWSHLSSVVHPNAPFEAEQILQRMSAQTQQQQQLHQRGGKLEGELSAAPDDVTYRMILRAWANSDAPHRGQRVAWWLERQWMDYEFEGREALKPTTASYNAVMRVWADLGEPRKVEEMLSDLIRRSKAQPDDPRLSPNSESYALVIRAWLAVADQGSRDALLSAVRWLDSLREKEQRDAGALSQVDMFSRILASARKCAPHWPDILDLAVETFDKLRDSHHAVECIHYSRLLQVGLLALSRPENNEVRTSFVRQIVHDCSEHGLISKPLLLALSNGPTYYDGWTIYESQRIVSELFPDWPLPQSWTRNVKQVGFLPNSADLERTMFDVARHGVDPYK